MNRANYADNLRYRPACFACQAFISKVDLLKNVSAWPSVLLRGAFLQTPDIPLL